MSKSKKSYAEIISQVEIMCSGLKNNHQEITKRGIDLDFIENLESLRSKVIELNNNQERLKAELRAQTKLINDNMDIILSNMREARKVVKLAISQPKWIEFGITDKR